MLMRREFFLRRDFRSDPRPRAPTSPDRQRERREREREDGERRERDERARRAELVALVECFGVAQSQHDEEQYDVEEAARDAVPEPAQGREREHRKKSNAPHMPMQAFAE